MLEYGQIAAIFVDNAAHSVPVQHGVVQSGWLVTRTRDAVMYGVQVVAWMVHGLLLDNHEVLVPHTHV